MKNNKNTKYILITLVLMIWGVIIYRVIKGMSGDEVAMPVSPSKPVAKKEPDFSYILLNTPYPDPFKNKIISPSNPFTNNTLQNNGPGTQQNGLNNNSMQGQAMINVPKPAPAMALAEQPPAVKFSGYIYNPQTKKKTALISYNGRPMVVGVADKLDDKTRILKIDEQKLTLSFKGKTIIVNVGG